MQMVVLTNEGLKEELLRGVEKLPENISWLEEVSKLGDFTNADVVVDLLFAKDHLSALKQCKGLVIINSVEDCLSETDNAFVRINAWPTLLKSALVEAAAASEDGRKKAEEVFAVFNKKLEWVADETGFITPRVISMIINEAYLSLHEGVSTEADIDTAMKLGTNYPFGPFEWSEKIGRSKIFSLLQKLERVDPKYSPSYLLGQQESV